MDKTAKDIRKILQKVLITPIIFIAWLNVLRIGHRQGFISYWEEK